MSDSPYLAAEDRLSDVISAIQTLGSYRFYKLSAEAWSERICGDAAKKARWKRVFLEHPEFFRASGNGSKFSLVLRRQRPKLFSVDTLELVTRDQRESMNPEEQSRITRAPLSESEMNMLIELAMSLHSKALEDRRDSRWWVPVITTVAVALIGLIGVWLGAKLGK